MRKKIYFFHLLGLSLLCTWPIASQAHCSWLHPHHCLADVAGALFGSVEKRAKMVWHDPVGSLINPLKVIDESIPTPMSYVEYVIKNPNEVIEVLKNPVVGVIGLPAALAITDGRNSALRNGTLPMPHEMRTKLAPFFSKKILDSVRYTTSRSLFNGITQGIAVNTGALAITLVNVIVFRDASQANNSRVWAHELFHVRQYSELGLTEFAATLVLDPGTGGAIEGPAYRFDQHYGEIEATATVSTNLLTGLGDKCMASAADVQGSDVTLQWCSPRSDTQQWKFMTSGEIRTPGNLCLDVTGGNSTNRTPLQLWACNNTASQGFTFSESGEIRNKLRDRLCIEVAGGRTTIGTPIQTYDCNRTAAQSWHKPHVTLLSANEDRCLSAGSSRSGSQVRLSSCNLNDRRQQWALDGDLGRARLAQTPTLCLDVPGGNSSNGTQLQVYTCNGTLSQVFRFTDRWEIRSELSANRCVDVPGGRVETLDPMQIYGCNNSPAQKWLYEAPSGSPAVVTRPIDQTTDTVSDRI